VVERLGESQATRAAPVRLLLIAQRSSVRGWFKRWCRPEPWPDGEHASQQVPYLVRRLAAAPVGDVSRSCRGRY